MDQEKKEAFLTQLQTHRLIIYKICNAYCRNTSDQDDLAQEISYQLWRSFHHFNGRVKFSTWMYRVALNVAITFHRSAKTKQNIITLDEPATEPADDMDQHAEREMNINTLQRFISELKELDKALMILYLEEKSYNEIADILGITETNVATRISRIKDKLKQKFSTINK